MSDIDSAAETANAVGLRAVPAQNSIGGRLVVVHPPELRQVMTVDTVCEVGRRTRQGVALAHGTVSRHHATLSVDRRTGEWAISDAGSRNGTWLDGQRLGEPALRLNGGAVVRFGDVLAVFELPQHALAASAAISPDAAPGRAAVMQSLRAELAQAGPDIAPVLVQGETGTGKERIAKELHRVSRRRGPLLTFNCAELNEQLADSQLFGHERGAFTGASQASEGLFRAADGGTLFLDEIGELPIGLQSKLLRVLQEGEVRPLGGTRLHRVDVRVVAATNRALSAMIGDGTFRQDLYARLALWEIFVPPLRERRADILDWVHRLRHAWANKRNQTLEPLTLSVDAAERLLLHHWPSNLREIERFVHRIGQQAVVDLRGLPEFISTPRADKATPLPKAKPAAPTKQALIAALQAHGGSVRAVAKYFQRDRRQVYRWMDAHGIERS